MKELRETSQLLLDHLEKLGATEIEIDADYYWHVPRSQLYDPTIQIVEPDLGQLTEDWARLEAIRRGDMPPVGPGLEWLSAIFRAVGEHVIG